MADAIVVPSLVRTRLSVMMFLQYAIWGAWLPILYPFLLGHRGFDLDQVGAIFSAGAVGAILGPFLAGQVADRYFATERFLGLSHLVGAAMVWFLAGIDDFNAFLAVSFVYGLVYAPTLALTNSISFANLPDRDRDFGKVRVWGTVGWIAAGITVGQWLAFQHSPEAVTPDALSAAQNAGRADAFRLSAMLGVLMGVYCFTLPHTPPSTAPKESNASLKAIKEVKRSPLWILFLLAVPISVVHQFYFVHTSGFLTEVQNRSGDTGLSDTINSVFGVGGGGLMTIGQVTEILVIALIPLVAKKWSRKTLLAIGIVAYAARMALFAYLPTISGTLGLSELIIAIAGVGLHGVCFGCFIFVAFMIVDEQTTPDVRASAQNLFNLVIIGIGIIVGSWFATSIVAAWAKGGSDAMDYTRLFSVPMWMAIGCLAVLMLLYPKHPKVIEPADQTETA